MPPEEGEASLRLFVAALPPPDLRGRLEEMQQALRGESWKVSWSPPSQFHLTLHFLGKTPQRVVPDLHRELGACVHALRPFEIPAGGLGVFPDFDNPRILWAGLEDPHGKLQDLFERSRRILARYRLFKLPESYTPHITLGRVRDLQGWDGRRLAGLRADWKRLGRFPVEELVMFKSKTDPEGSVHEEVFRVRLGGEG